MRVCEPSELGEITGLSSIPREHRHRNHSQSQHFHPPQYLRNQMFRDGRDCDQWTPTPSTQDPGSEPPQCSRLHRISRQATAGRRPCGSHSSPARRPLRRVRRVRVVRFPLARDWRLSPRGRSKTRHGTTLHDEAGGLS
jgi:hypothetical protein